MQTIFPTVVEPWISARELSILTGMDERMIGLWSQKAEPRKVEVAQGGKPGAPVKHVEIVPDVERREPAPLPSDG